MMQRKRLEAGISFAGNPGKTLTDPAELPGAAVELNLRAKTKT